MRFDRYVCSSSLPKSPKRDDSCHFSLRPYFVRFGFFLSRRRQHRWRFPSLVVGFLSILVPFFGACETKLEEAQLFCDPEDPKRCPPGWVCQARGVGGEHRCYSTVGGYCGNGVRDLETGEQCDATDFGGSSCEDFGLQQGAMICRSDCTVYCTVCGNGILEVNADGQGEVCDLGEQNSNEPNASCRLNCTPRRCGDGIVDFSSGEDCEEDDLGPVEPSCQDFGFHYGEVRCNSNCRYDTSGCSETCGDGVINGMEQCDGADLNGTTCSSLNYYGGELACSSLCTFDTSGDRKSVV